MTARIQSPATVRIKGATRLLFRECGGLEAVALIAGISPSQAGRYQNVNEPDVITADKIAALECEPGVRPRLTEILAASCGCVLTPLAAALSDGAWGGRLGELAREFGAIATNIGLALEDGEITGDEVARLGLRANVAALSTTLAGIDRALEEIERRDTAVEIDVTKVTPLKR